VYKDHISVYGCIKFDVDTTYGLLDTETNYKILTDRQMDIINKHAGVTNAIRQTTEDWF